MSCFSSLGKPHQRQLKEQPIGSTKQEDLSVSISCVYTDDDTVDYSCQSTNFTDLEYTQCNLRVLYIYTITNHRDITVQLEQLIDENFSNIIYESMLIEGQTSITIRQIETLDICTTRIRDRRVAAIAQSVSDKSPLPLAHNAIQFQTP